MGELIVPHKIVVRTPPPQKKSIKQRGAQRRIMMAFAATLIPVVEVSIQVLTLLNLGSLQEDLAQYLAIEAIKVYSPCVAILSEFAFPVTSPRLSINLYQEIALWGLGASPLTIGWGTRGTSGQVLPNSKLSCP